MENCKSILSIHNGMGTTQNDRVKPALQPDFFLLDERNEQDFILFVQKLSEYVNFFNEYNISESNWSVFFQKESTSILILIAHWNIELLPNSFEVKKNEIYLIVDPTTQKTRLIEYFNLIYTEFDKLEKKTKLLDDEIIEKENLVAAAYSIKNQFELIKNQINSSADISALLKNYVFIKTTQQLFGLLLSWKNFTKSAIDFQLNSYPKHSPQYTLFLSFLKLLDIAKSKLNEYTKNHLDFYYKDILRTENQNAKPDYVHLTVEPFDAKPFLIPKGTAFIAEKNSIGQKKFYESTADQAVNGIKLHSFLSMYRQQDSYFKADLLAFNTKNKGFNAFTTEKQSYKEGIMIASPIFYLQSGERIISLRFNDKDYKASDFDFYITGEKKTFEITSKDNNEKESKTGKNYIRLKIPATEKKIIPFDKKLHAEFLIQTEFPVLKIVPKNINIITAIETISIQVDVNQFKSFVLDSDFGKIDTEKAFFPFGEIPKTGNGMIISSNEFFMKKNAIASIILKSDTQHYNLKPFTLTNGVYEEYKKEASFLMPILIPNLSPYYYNVSLLNEFQIYQALPIRSSNEFTAESSSNTIVIPNLYPLSEYNYKEIASNQIVANGKFRIELFDNAFNADAFMFKYIVAATKPATPLPYKPRVKEFTFNYSVTENIKLNTRSGEDNPIDIYSILPFGYAKIMNKEVFHFIQKNPLEGTLFLGFEKANPNDGLRFLIQLEEGTANPLLEPAKVSYEYLDKNTWKKSDSNAIGDETFSLTQSGLISITIPEFDSTSNTELESNLFWLKISVSNIEAVCKFVGVHAQALKAVLTDYEKSGAVFLENTPKETISKIYTPINKVKKIIQPYSSFSGRIKEPDSALYTRTSERLRHKNRAITTWDYEKIVLQEFPEVYRVKALNHYRFDTMISNVSAGYVTLIPVAKSSVSDNINWKPLLSLNKMLLIKEHLAKIASPHVRINVKAPKQEKVEVIFKVKFHLQEGMNSGLYITELKQTINTYLSPWAYETSEINFANEIEFSSLIQLIDNQSYVDYLIDFKVSQYILDANNEVVGSAIQNLNKISPQTDYTLFIPNDSHQILAI
ncbi:baseplate J-like protein [Flavobacterium sp. 1]|uniref:baseplate J/gp47 family protein n=1 Tax=Flavobacterium sp. 1 TaxID=2035200 RepID=UPI000C238235|nr:baseplate J/gp47 family protein [Flavobacterium sp. 1]PJJ10318.1 baseplate J-like protein [Flavobacterium sp. 1]